MSDDAVGQIRDAITQLKAMDKLLEREHHKTLGQCVAIALAMRALMDTMQVDRDAFLTRFEEFSAGIRAHDEDAQGNFAAEAFRLGFREIAQVLEVSDPTIWVKR